ncbi:hypothetical protein [Burkholderia sp. LMG 21824]|uniref:hypothetical protein n=1 Tax=Burkholderia sp. LMG 21824 TaxID=3158172 RepID=UPI003C2EB7C1
MSDIDASCMTAPFGRVWIRSPLQPRGSSSAARAARRIQNNLSDPPIASPILERHWHPPPNCAQTEPNKDRHMTTATPSIAHHTVIANGIRQY